MPLVITSLISMLVIDVYNTWKVDTGRCDRMLLQFMKSLMKQC